MCPIVVALVGGPFGQFESLVGDRRCWVVPSYLLWWAVSVTTPVVALPTVGGAAIDIRGSGLGLSATAVSVTYTGGSLGMMRRSYTLPQGACTLVSPGTALRWVSS